MTLRWGLLSTARINARFIGGCRQTESALVQAVASRSADRARGYATEHQIPRAHGSYQELLADPEIDAVYISLPNSLHLEWSERALRAGKHVLCEKPLSRDPAALGAAFDLAQRQRLVLMEAFMYRHNPQTARLAEIVGAGAIGRLALIRASFSFPIASRSDVRLKPELDGGALMDVGCYCVNAARLLAGEPVAVAGLQAIGGDGVDVAFTGSLGFAGDVVAHFDAGLQMASRGELEVVGDRGSLFLDDPWHCREPVIELRDGRGVHRIALEPVDSYMLQAENMAQAAAGSAPALLGREDAVGQAATIQALYRSAAQGETAVVDHG